MIIYNAIQTPDGTIIRSIHGHDYVEHTDANGHTYAVDGGMQYLRRVTSVGAPAYLEQSLDSKDCAHDIVRDFTVWGTRGKDGMQPLTYVPIKALDTEHIQAILATQQQIRTELKDIFINELEYRNK